MVSHTFKYNNREIYQDDLKAKIVTLVVDNPESNIKWKSNAGYWKDQFHVKIRTTSELFEDLYKDVKTARREAGYS